MLADSGYVRRGPVRGTYVREKEKESTKGGKGGYRHMLYLDDFPMVMIDKKMRGIPVPSVRTVNRAVAASLVRELAREGCGKIAFLLRRIRKQFPSGNAETVLSVKWNG